MASTNTKDKAYDDPNGEYDEITDEDPDDEYFSATDGVDSEGRKKPPRINMYCKYTHYEIVKEVGKHICEFHLTKKSRSDWDIAWFDGPSPGYLINLIKNMSFHQRTNHYPGINNLARKNMLGRHLMKMKKLLPNDYNFFPQTYMLPHDYKDFREDSVNSKYPVSYIVKPEDSCQGKGIYITRNWDAIKPTDQMVVQKYMMKPHLIDKFKYDLRIYVFVNGINPLRIYVYKDGLARFATVPYQKPSDKNCNNLFMHLTNYAINKDSENFVLNEQKGSKRSYQSILDHIQETHGIAAMHKVQQGIHEIIIKCMCMVQPHVNHLVRASQPDDLENQMIFQILGFDIMLDAKLRPSLIEINQMPSFQTDSTLDLRVKKGLIMDVLKTLCLNMNRKNAYKKEKRNKVNDRLMKPTLKLSSEITQDLIKPTAESSQQEKDAYQQIMAEEQRKIKARAKQIQAETRRKNLINRALIREKNEAAVCNDLVLIYPIVSYDNEFKLEAQLPLNEKKLHQEIAIKKKEALDRANGNRFNVDFNVQRDVYSKICPGKVRDYVYELDVHLYNSKGERAQPEEKTAEQLADLEFRNYVYEMSFQDVEKIQKEAHKQRIQQAKIRKQQLKNRPKQPKKSKKRVKEEDEYDDEEKDDEEDEEDPEQDEEEDDEEEEEEEEEDDLTAVKFDVRDDWIQQMKYVKYMEQANFLWDQFTSGNTLQRLKKAKEQEELEERMRIAEKERKAAENAKNQRKFKEQLKEQKQKEEQLYLMFKAEMEEEEKQEEKQSEEKQQDNIKSKTAESNNVSFRNLFNVQDGTATVDTLITQAQLANDNEMLFRKKRKARNIYRGRSSNTMQKQMQNTTIQFSTTQAEPNSTIAQADLMNNTKSSYFLPELSSPIKFTLTPLTKYQGKQSMIHNSPHIIHAIQPVINKGKHVDYYKHMKEKYQQKRLQAENESLGLALSISPTKMNRKVNHPNIVKQNFMMNNTQGLGSLIINNKDRISSNVSTNNTSGSVSAKVEDHTVNKYDKLPHLGGKKMSYQHGRFLDEDKTFRTRNLHAKRPTVVANYKTIYFK